MRIVPDPKLICVLDNSCYLPNAEFSGPVAKTNVASNTAFRGFGGPQDMLVIEEVIDRIARRLELRRILFKNANPALRTGLRSRLS
jgi:xanthine dehydrogenase molybdopterin-binding subunit B